MVPTVSPFAKPSAIVTDKLNRSVSNSAKRKLTLLSNGYRDTATSLAKKQLTKQRKRLQKKKEHTAQQVKSKTKSQIALGSKKYIQISLRQERNKYNPEKTRWIWPEEEAVNTSLLPLMTINSTTMCTQSAQNVTTIITT